MVRSDRHRSCVRIRTGRLGAFAPSKRLAQSDGSPRHCSRAGARNHRSRTPAGTGTRRGRFGGGNVVDLPALEWLARQHAPRIWVSDGRVTGVHDTPCPELWRRCKRVVDRARITRVKNAEEAAKRLAG